MPFNIPRTDKTRANRQQGYTLIETVLVLVIMGILAAVAVKQMAGPADLARLEETRAEMEILAHAIAGDPARTSGGQRTEFGYLGDIGALPSTWEALLTNPGLATWRGPYLQEKITSGTGVDEFKLDGWGREYSAPNAISFSSTGGPQTITRQLAPSLDMLLRNSATFAIADRNGTVPGPVHKDSVQVILTSPDGAGGMITRTKSPDRNGAVRFDSLPIGSHAAKTVFIQQNDTLTRRITVSPGESYHAEVRYIDDIWSADSAPPPPSGGALILVAGSVQRTDNSHTIRFRVRNSSAQPVTILWIRGSYTGSTAYYERILRESTIFWEWGSIRRGASGEAKNGTWVFPGNSQSWMRFRYFRTGQTGSASYSTVNGRSFTILFSDGSQIAFTAP
jgi:prepilin-type N-terminal cleavage/methylation domain-containing protein